MIKNELRPGHRAGNRFDDTNVAFEPHYVPGDTLYAGEWHLRNTGQNGGTAGIDLNVSAVWDDYTGAGISVGIFDDAVDYNHSDLNDNYDASLHVVVNGTTYSALPMNWGSGGDSHGTAVAGIIAAENNGIGSVGVAFDATITGVPVTRSSNSVNTLAALAEMDRFDVVNNSWGYSTPFYTNFSSATDFWISFAASLSDAAAIGRGGLGTIVVKSAGNSRGSGHETTYDNFTSDRHVIAVGAVDNRGMVSYYSNPGATLLVSAPSSNVTVGITTTDLSGANGVDPGDFRSNFGGTSAAAPMVSGVVALILDANPNLGWRDVQEILVYSARKVGSTTGSLAGYEEYVWGSNAALNWNGGGLHFSNDYGFGLVDALAAVRLAESWTRQSTSINEVSVTANSLAAAAIPDLGSVSRTLTLGGNVRIDHLELSVNITHPNRGDLRITITSPSGTVSIVLDRPLNGTDATDNLVFKLASNAFWGELSGGTWTVTVTDTNGGNAGTVNSLTLTAYGDTSGSDDLYVYTNEYGSLGLLAPRAVLSDSNGGIDTLNAAAVTAGSVLDLRAGAVSTIAGRALTIAAGTQIENAWGGDGADTITGNAAVNQLNGGRGNDTLEGGAGNDRIDGGAGQDVARFAGLHTRYTITAQTGGYLVTDNLANSDGSDFLSGIEQIQFADGLYNLDGTLVSGGSGGSGATNPNDTLTGSAGNDTLDGGAGDDQLAGLDGNDRLIGGTGADRIDGGAGIDVAEFLASLLGVTVNLASNANANGDAAGDQLLGIENLTGSQFADQLTGDGGTNQLLGMGGDDRLDGGGGADNLAGGLGNDTYTIDNAGDLASENAGEGIDTVIAALGWTLGANLENLTLTGSAAINGTGNGLANALNGNAAANMLDGAAGNDTLYGGAGNDTLYGRDGADLLDGGDGADVLTGGAGSDDLRGGTGADRFDFDAIAELPLGGGDRILDFARGSDRIDLSSIDANAGTRKNDAFQFIGNTAFSGRAGELRYQWVDQTGTSNDYTLIQGDINGDRVIDFEIMLHGQLAPLQSIDFIL